ncbi:metallophosphoesterase family protein [Alicyclobacillus shizuokensis]|uniref:metallophosphoesterase family protein n=1 Tax=Alicyclobacillus shizuokensis TaxID=392014 RepID=UPI0008309A3E|nr:metallophosphoesterase [Alicyclobacillus shizuokensis]
MWWPRKAKSQVRKPKVWGKTLLVLSDLHGDPFRLPTDVRPDLILLLGDIPYYAVQDVDRQWDCPKVGVMGNHDGIDTFEGTRVVDVHAKTIDIDGLRIAGFGGAPRYNAKRYGQYEEEEARAFIDQLEPVDIFIAHSNPKWTDEPVQYRAHAGFRSFAKYIERAQPAHFFHGHEHVLEEKRIGSTKLHAVYGVRVYYI